jgi:hypothetical protein
MHTKRERYAVRLVDRFTRASFLCIDHETQAHLAVTRS